MFFRSFVFSLLFISCSVVEEYKRPSFIVFHVENDSIFVKVKNKVLSSSFLEIKNLKDGESSILNFKKPDTVTILRFHKSEIDTVSINKNYRFTLKYGLSYFKKHDSLYNYGLPFLKGKRYKVLQGQNSNFTHKGDFSRYAIDFKMNIGQPICAIREGLVVNIKEDSNKGGKDKSYRNDANYIVIFHKDGTFAQYIHLKKNGVVVSIGETVKKGQVIGYSGNTGFSTQPHLHFAVYKSFSKKGLVSIPYILDAISAEEYKKGTYVYHN
tara:strand:+ start:7281 stop:8084 length:804 start_codon:yes stop_codon:yes gene_type:complete